MGAAASSFEVVLGAFFNFGEGESLARNWAGVREVSSSRDDCLRDFRGVLDSEISIPSDVQPS